VAHALTAAAGYPREAIMVINISGRGEKDLFITARALDKSNWIDFLRREVERE
jgi:tryptophan synthase beta chain